MQGSVVHLVLIGREAIRLGFGRLSESSVARIVSTFPFPNVDPVLHLTVSDPHSRLAAETPPDCSPPPPCGPAYLREGSHQAPDDRTGQFIYCGS